MSRIAIKVSEIIDLNARFREINSTNLGDIDFLNDKGEILYIKKELIDQWNFIGLNNTDFIDTSFYQYGFSEDELKIYEK
jgi:phage pi2 protein 07|tara:strand:- start:1157 stop:1396 length:240 start_codon:yes stop_codon:yes gene_type:complete